MDIFVFTGAGISAESGLATFRDSDGLWENHRVEDVATPGGWKKDRVLVLDFYNKRRAAAMAAEPNAAHLALARLEERHNVTIATQNIDDLHERAGSTKVFHLHGSLFRVRSSRNPGLVVSDWRKDLVLGDKASDGSQLRPDVVWFGEPVQQFGEAIAHCLTSECLVVVGTSGKVWPAASLINHYSGHHKYLVDPQVPAGLEDLTSIAKPATIGVPELVNRLMCL